MYWDFVASGVRPLRSLSRFLSRVGPVGLDRRPEVPQAFFVGVAVLHDQRADALGMLEREPVADRRAIIHHIKRITFRAEMVEQTVGQVGEFREAVGEVLARPASRSGRSPDSRAR